MNASPVSRLAARYPQLLLAIEEHAKDTPEYKDVVLRGKPVFGEPDFLGSPEDELSTVDTPVGRVDVLTLGNRADFEHALRALAYRCEPVEIPASVGASTIRGLINWQKIREHRESFLAAGGTDWGEEFKHFTADKKNYLDSIILLSSGFYSALPPSAAGLPEGEWREKSHVIRKYHEITHFVCRSLCPRDIEAIRDEVIADCIGLTAAFGCYDAALAKRFLGIEEGVFRSGGRLSHYAEPETLPEAAAAASALIEKLASRESGARGQDIFDTLLALIHEYYREANV